MNDTSVLNFSILSIVVNFIFYVIVSILLNMFYKNKYGKSTILAFIPILHIYIIGKLLSGKALGIVLVILGVFNMNARFSVYLGDKKVTIPLGSVFWILLLIFIIVLLIKYLKKKSYDKEHPLKRYIFKNDNYHNGCMMKVLDSLGGNELDYNWLVTDMDTYFTDDDYLFLSTKELLDLIEKNKDPQWIWGVFTAIPKKYSRKDVLKNDIPTVVDNKEVWESPIIQHPLADIEIICYDSSFYTIVSKEEKYIDMLKNTFPSLKEDK